MAVEISQINPFGSFNIGLGAIGNGLALFFIVFLILGGIGFLIFQRISKKQFKHVIPLYKLIGNVPTRVGIYRAKDFAISKAGDKLWFVSGVKKFIPPATLQSAPNEYMHWEREDGEWINFVMGDLDKSQKQAGVKYIVQDMRSQRIATNNILEQRLLNKGFWDKYKDLIIHLGFYLITTIMLVIIFWMWSDIVTDVAGLVDKLDTLITKMENLKCVDKINSIVPTA